MSRTKKKNIQKKSKSKQKFDTMIKYKNRKILQSNNIFKDHKKYKTQYSCYYNEYKKLLNKKYNFKDYYRDYESDIQFKSLVEIGLKYDASIFTRLIELISNRFNPGSIPEIINILLEKKNDTYTYNKLYDLFKKKINSTASISSLSCNRNNIFSELFTNKINNILEDKKVEKILDIGTGDGEFIINFGNKLNLKKDNIVGCDLDNFSEKGNQSREKNKDKFVFVPIEVDTKIPLNDNSFDLITMKFVIHHINNIDFILKEVKRLLKKNGLFLLIDHDIISFADYMLTDIEHGLFINIYNKQTNKEKITNEEETKNKKSNDDIMIVRYYDWVEMNYLMEKYKFTYLEGDILSNNINKRVRATRAFYSFYQINKN